jgi:hypothetical protein
MERLGSLSITRKGRDAFLGTIREGAVHLSALKKKGEVISWHYERRRGASLSNIKERRGASLSNIN